MIRVSRTYTVTAVLLAAIIAGGIGCGATGGSSIVPFAGTVPQSAKDLDGTYNVGLSASDASTLGQNLTIVISGGLFTKLGLRDLTPTNLTNSGNDYVWTSGAAVQYSGTPVPLDTSITLTMTLQADKTMVGTIQLSSYGVMSQAINATLTKQ